MGSVLCCVDADPAPAYEIGGPGTARTVLSPGAAEPLKALLRRLQEHGSVHARQYPQYRCTCDNGACPRMRSVGKAVDAFLSQNGLDTPIMPSVGALSRVLASLAMFDERRSLDVAFVAAAHRALVASDGDEALAFALMVETAFAAAAPA